MLYLITIQLNYLIYWWIRLCLLLQTNNLHALNDGDLCVIPILRSGEVAVYAYEMPTSAT
jgi:hypothetical protein